MNKKGITLIELLVVLVIIGIVTTIGFVTFGRITENSKKKVFIADAVSVVEATKVMILNDEHQDNCINNNIIYICYLETLKDLGHIENITSDPWDDYYSETSYVIYNSDENSFRITFSTIKDHPDSPNPDLSSIRFIYATYEELLEGDLSLVQENK